MAVLVVLLAAMLFVGAASAAGVTPVIPANETGSAPQVYNGELVNVSITYIDGTTDPKVPSVANDTLKLGNQEGINLTYVDVASKTIYAEFKPTANGEQQITLGTAKAGTKTTATLDVTNAYVNVVAVPTKAELQFNPAIESYVGGMSAPYTITPTGDLIDGCNYVVEVNGKYSVLASTGSIIIPNVDAQNPIVTFNVVGLTRAAVASDLETDPSAVAVTLGSASIQVTPAPVAAKELGTYFVYEKPVIEGVTTLYKLSGDATPTVLDTIEADANGVFDLNKGAVGGNYGVWYTSATPGDYVSIWYPEITLKAELATPGDLVGTVYQATTAGDSINGKTINKDTPITFLIESSKLGPAYTDGFEPTVKIVFTTPANGKTTNFGGYGFDAIPVNGAEVKAAATITGDDTNTSQYATAGSSTIAGTWTAQAEFIPFNATNHNGGNAFAGFKNYADKSNSISFTVQSTTLTITTDKDSVIRSNPFTVTIQGNSQTPYAVYLDKVSATDVNPYPQAAQIGFLSDSRFGPLGNGYAVYDGYIYVVDEQGNKLTDAIGGMFNTDASGQRTIQFNTGADTTDKTYTVKVSGINEEKGTFDTTKYDTVKVKVEKGAVTISASGDGSYYIGEEIILSGTNTDSDYIFLFITGPNLLSDGVQLKSITVANAYAKANTAPETVNTDNTWEYKWDTTGCNLDSGAYTIYATSVLTNGKASSPALTNSEYGVELTESNCEDYGFNSEDISGNYKYVAVKLSDSQYATVSVNLKKPFLSAVPSGTVVAKGDTMYIRGTAEGNPNELKMYLFGPNFYMIESITPEDDGTYEKKLDVGADWASNQYYVVIEHPMENGKIDVHQGKNGDVTTLYVNNVNTAGSQSSFIVDGPGKLQSSNAANALTTMIDSANIDDIYTKLTFMVDEPRIIITNPGDQGVGTKFTISGTTNLAVDDQILVDVSSSSFNAVDKTQASETSGISMTTKVVAGDGVENTWSVEVDTTNWKLDEYTIKASGIEVDVTTTTNFNLVEKVVTPTATATGATPTTTATATATTAPTQTPGFGAFVALAGLGAVALLVLRRN